MLIKQNSAAVKIIEKSRKKESDYVILFKKVFHLYDLEGFLF